MAVSSRSAQCIIFATMGNSGSVLDTVEDGLALARPRSIGSQDIWIIV